MNINFNNVADEAVYTVSEITRFIKDMMEGSFYDIRVKGEVSGLKTNYSSGIYFDLKDEYAKLKCIIFKNDAKKIKFDIKEGLSVTAFGRINLYEPRGEYSFIISEIEPSGYGELYLLFEQLKEKLKSEGLFDESHKRNIPFLPETIGIVTSRSGAVLHDMIKIIRSRFKNVSIIFANASVQGKNSSAEIAYAIDLLNLYSRTQKKVDVIIVGRGGGSIEDLWAFNEEAAARAIYNSEVPVISAVGHETDFTIADFVADRRASTPSNAAEMVVPVKFELIKQIKSLRGRLEQGIFNIILTKKDALSNLIKNRETASPKRSIQDRTLRVYDLTDSLSKSIISHIHLHTINLEHLNKRLLLRSPLLIFNEKRVYIYNLLDRLKRGVDGLILNYKNRLKTENKALSSLSPYNVLKRGYGIVFTDEKKVISSAFSVEENENIKIKFHDGTIKAVVKSKSDSPF
ncbi:MAG: exodeoxyribonuclease VII large subunit [Deltaproteobacteria bacterium]|jgi:exodeoxyribonuclease VII large subunit|nr:exodeoxyribonuclease VII large subunit [Deltaproteobacteria bacterium]MCL5880890.1 exodeoxyribonuclease VII large subunit [Deltaproteobacteria bacterium]MDA8303727.1 exodeoxyribonuclease VII large subunit [Deltaproteobacteria bacterium]